MQERRLLQGWDKDEPNTSLREVSLRRNSRIIACDYVITLSDEIALQAALDDGDCGYGRRCAP